jgi:hypothetical protein
MRYGTASAFRGIVAGLAYVLAICLTILVGIELAADFLTPGLRLSMAAPIDGGAGIGYLALGVAALAAALRLGRTFVDRLHARLEGGIIPHFAAPPAMAPPRISRGMASSGMIAVDHGRVRLPASAR